MSFLTIDGDSSVAPYEQIREQVIAAVRSGKLTAGVKLPTVRGLADQLGLATNTAAKAYRALERDGIIETRGRNGTFISAQGDVIQQQAQIAAVAYAERVHALGVNRDEALAYVHAALGIHS